MKRHLQTRAAWPVPVVLSLALAWPALAEDRDEGAWLEAAALDRSALVRAVLASNRTLAAARASSHAAAARVRSSGVLADPTVTGGIAPLSIGSSRARVGWEASISERLPWPGKLRAETAAAQADAEASRDDLEEGRRQLALAACGLFDDYFADVRSLEVNERHRALMRTMQEAAAGQYEAGRASAQDALEAELELAHMEHDAAVLEAQRRVTVARLNELLHRPPEAPLPPPPGALVPSARSGGTDPGRLQAEAVARRPDIAAARTRARAEAARAERASRDLLPDVTVSTSFDSMWDTPEHRWMVGLGVDLPLPSGRRAGAVEEADAMRAFHEAEAEQKADAARTEVAVALARLDESEHLVHLLAERIVPVARTRVETARAAFAASRAPFASAIEAERDLRSAELELEEGLAECDRRSAELDRALGRVPGLASPEVSP